VGDCCGKVGLAFSRVVSWHRVYVSRWVDLLRGRVVSQYFGQARKTSLTLHVPISDFSGAPRGVQCRGRIDVVGRRSMSLSVWSRTAL
jgi:hypothetical protein